MKQSSTLKKDKCNFYNCHLCDKKIAKSNGFVIHTRSCEQYIHKTAVLLLKFKNTKKL